MIHIASEPSMSNSRLATYLDILLRSLPEHVTEEGNTYAGPALLTGRDLVVLREVMLRLEEDPERTREEVEP